MHWLYLELKPAFSHQVQRSKERASEALMLTALHSICSASAGFLCLLFLVLNLLQFLCESWTHNNLFITFSKSGPVWSFYALFLLPLFSADLSCWKGMEHFTENPSVSAGCRQISSKNENEMSEELQPHHMVSVLFLSYCGLTRKTGMARGQKSTADKPPPSASPLGVKLNNTKEIQRHANVGIWNKKAHITM